MKIDIDDFRVVAHDMANLLTIANSHYHHLLKEKPELKDDSSFAKLYSLHDRMFEQVNFLHRAVEALGEQGVLSIYEGEEICLGDRFAYLRENLEKINQCYNLQVILDTSRCADSVIVWSNMELARVTSENVLRNAAQAGATRVFHIYVDRGEYVEVIFRDDGRGMSEEVIRRLGMGYSCSGRGEGTRMTKKMIASVGGSVEWRSIENIGTEVIFRLKKVGVKEVEEASSSRCVRPAGTSSDIESH